MKKEGTLGETPSKRDAKTINIDPKIVQKTRCEKSAKNEKNGGDGVHAAPPQEHFISKDPSEVIYLMKKEKHQ